MSNRHSFIRNGWVVSDMTLVFSVRRSFGRPLVISCFARLTDFEVGLLIGPHWTASIINNLLATWRKKKKKGENRRGSFECSRITWQSVRVRAIKSTCFNIPAKYRTSITLFSPLQKGFQTALKSLPAIHALFEKKKLNGHIE